MNLLRNISPDRREQFRKVPDKFAFLQLERDDGGSVLDISEGGMRFETFSPVPQVGPVHLWFSLNLLERIEAWGEVVWINGAKKCGGLRFLRLSREDRAQIREYVSQPSLQEVAEEKFSGWRATKEMLAKIGVREGDAVARFVSKARAWEAPAANPPALAPLSSFPGRGEAAAGTSTLFPPPEQVGTSGELVPMQRHLSAKRRQLILGLILGACISGSVAVATIKYSNSHRESRGSGKTPAELATPKSPVTTLPPAAASPSTPGTVSPDIFGGGGSQNKAVGKGHTPSSSVPAAETGAPARPLLQPSSSSTPSRQKSAMTPQQLWVSVQSGNTKSAVALAELYIKGEGVPQNCDQARVLLLVASEKRDAEAIKRLAELDKTGCPAS